MNTISKAELQAFIRTNGLAWPGGYPMVLVMTDGDVIDAQAARENYRLIRQASDPRDPWYAIGIDIHWEGQPLECAHSGRLIDSAYGE